MSQAAVNDTNTRTEEFDRFDLLEWEQGSVYAYARQWPIMGREAWCLGSKVESIQFANILEKGWEAVSVTTHTRGWMWWRPEIRTWLFQKRIPCVK